MHPNGRLRVVRHLALHRPFKSQTFISKFRDQCLTCNEDPKLPRPHPPGLTATAVQQPPRHHRDASESGCEMKLKQGTYCSILSLYLCSIYLHLSEPICISVSTSVSISQFLAVSTHIPTYLPCLPVDPSIYLSIYLLTYLSNLSKLSIYLSV